MAPLPRPPGAPPEDGSLATLFEAAAVLGLRAEQVQVFDPAHPRFDATRLLLVLRPAFDAARAAIADRYPGDHGARAVTGGAQHTVEVAALPSAADAWCIEPLAPEDDARSLEGLRAVMERLYGPNGCPWDREQTHASLRRYLLEECYEVVEAIDRLSGDAGATDHLREELGDLLAHVFMHTSMAQEHGEFRVEDVTEGAVRKFVRRHPHVFGEEAAGSSEELLARWEEIKAGERSQDPAGEAPGALDSVPRSAPALQRARLLQQRAAHAGGAEPDAPPVAALHDAVRALEAAPAADTGPALAGVLWAAVRVARALDVDAEELLRESANAFVTAFADLEALARASGVELAALPPEERLRPWTAGSLARDLRARQAQ